MDRTAAQNVDAYYADILDIPAMRDDPSVGQWRNTGPQILSLQNPVDNERVRGNPTSVEYADTFFNNNPYVANYWDDGSRRLDSQGTPTVTDTRWRPSDFPGRSFNELSTSGSFPDVSILER